MKIDLINISDYVERVSFSKSLANQLVAEIISSIQILAFFPYIYPKVYKNFHSFTVKNRRIFM